MLQNQFRNIKVFPFYFSRAFLFVLYITTVKLLMQTSMSTPDRYREIKLFLSFFVGIVNLIIRIERYDSK